MNLAWLSPLAFFVSGCNAWIEPLADTPENLRLAIFTVSLRKDADASGGSRVTTAQAEKMVQDASEFWHRKCGIGFKFMGHFERSADADGAPTSARGDGAIRDLQYRYSHVNYISAVFTGGIEFDIKEPDRTIGGFSVFPWALDRRAILMVGPYEGVFTHELGHYMGLEHVETDGYNLMFPADLVKNDQHVLTPDQCAKAKKYVLGYSHLRELCRPDSSDPELSQANCPPIGL